jgi:hypothetical protein
MEEDVDDDLLDYEPSPMYDGMEINVIYLSSTDYSLLEEDEVCMPVARILVDGGAAVNMMPYSTFKKLGKTDAKLIKMNMTIMGIGGEGPIGPKGVVSMKLTLGSKMIPTAFLSQGYNVTTTLS